MLQLKINEWINIYGINEKGKNIYFKPTLLVTQEMYSLFNLNYGYMKS